MKKLTIYLLCITALFSGCDRKSDLNIDGKSTDQRLTEALAAYQKKLVDAPYGWVLTEYTNGTALNGGVTQTGPKVIFSYYMKFDKSDKVSMISDFSLPMSTTFNTSSYFIKATQRPTLIFDTYSYVHTPCDPDASISNSPFGYGFGWGTDFEFSFADNIAAADLGDTIHLRGNLNKSDAILVKATQEEQQIFTTAGFGAYSTFNKILTYFKQVTGGTEPFELTPGIGGRSFNIKSASHPELINVAFQSTAHNIVLERPVTLGGQTIKSFNNLVWNAASKTISTSINGTTAATISPALAPLAPEADIAVNFYIEGSENPWLATAGFHVKGVDDAYNLLKLTYPGGNYFRFVFYPGGVGVGGGNFMDIVSPYFLGIDDNYPYLGSGGISNTFFDGDRIVFDMLDFGSPVVNPPDLLSTIILLATGKTAPPYAADSPGFYVVRKEDGTSYDMVSAGDALGWITWSHQ
ncbi:DUF4302 domain-containing protein [Chitinophaga sp. RAB17]|uniref:DUF4302 domain-containing protein n=1 Tax=Chitinophaga sp. RAB17 TaxID=3233049 RepID=UPI003F911E0D